MPTLTNVETLLVTVFLIGLLALAIKMLFFAGEGNHKKIMASFVCALAALFIFGIAIGGNFHAIAHGLAGIYN